MKKHVRKDGAAVRWPTENQQEQVWRDYRRRQSQIVADAVASPVWFETDPEHRDGYLLYESNQLIARWREADHPGLAAWIMERMHERKAALFMARGEAARLGRSSEAGKDSGDARDPRIVHAGLARVIRLCITRGEEPREYAADWATEYGLSRSTVYDLIGRVRNNG